MTAIIGPSGAGKSTIIDCIPRLKSPSAGKIFINNIDLKNLDIISLRKNIGFLSQTPQILPGTIRDHLNYGNKPLTDNELISVLKKVNCDTLINKLDNGLDTDLGSKGSKISGGEKKRLDLARVFIHKASLLILDEPSANLDKFSEKIIQEAIEKERLERKMTIIVIGHRIEWFKKFDQIVIVKGGQIEAIGTHSDLKVKSEWYNKAINS